MFMKRVGRAHKRARRRSGIGTKEWERGEEAGRGSDRRSEMAEQQSGYEKQRAETAEAKIDEFNQLNFLQCIPNQKVLQNIDRRYFEYQNINCIQLI
jgi:hypothetical protein